METTTDLWFAAFLKHKGYKLINYTVIQRGKVKFVFEIGANDYKLRKLDFVNNEISKIKQIIEELKDLGF